MTDSRSLKKLTRVAARGLAYGIPLAALAAPSTLPAAVVDLTPTLPASGLTTLAGAVFNTINNGAEVTSFTGPGLDYATPSSTVNITDPTPISRAVPIPLLGETFITNTFAFYTSAGTGWLRVRFVDNLSVIFLAAEYNDTPGGSIHVGAAVPEPSTGALAGLGVLAMGAMGVGRLRRRRALKHEEEAGSA